MENPKCARVARVALVVSYERRDGRVNARRRQRPRALGSGGRRVHSVRVRLSDLVADPDLGLTLLAGAGDPEVRGVYVTDLLDPRRYLGGGELVLTGLVWRSGPQDSDRFVAALAEAGVAALGAGTARLGSTPPDLVRACRRRGLPLVEVPVAVSFGTLSERVMAAHRALGRGWVAAVAEGADLDRVLERAAAELGTDCWVLSGTGWVVAGTAELPQRAELVRAYAESSARERRISTGGAHFHLHAVGEADPRLAGWFVAVGEHAGAAAAAELATVVALVRTRVDEARRISGRSVESALRRLLDGSSSTAEVVARLETLGLPQGEPTRAVLLSAGSGDERTATAVLRELAAATGLPVVTAPLHGAAAAVFADDEQHLAELPQRFRELLTGTRLRAGVSDIAAAGELRSALEEARYALRLAEAGEPESPAAAGESAVVTAAELASHRVLLASVPAELRRSYRQRVLGPLLDYDAEHDADLVRTLRTFLECAGSWQRCARRLHIHVNTLRYRISRVERITGRDLAEFATRVDFHLALQPIDRS